MSSSGVLSFSGDAPGEGHVVVEIAPLDPFNYELHFENGDIRQLIYYVIDMAHARWVFSCGNDEDLAANLGKLIEEQLWNGKRDILSPMRIYRAHS
ncbi:hypothetical protein [Foetidibacter luteolus]|uniref:hypothetical protein n=1 Tax=Foetidibacter luteolus TaxID=2608880 RepID=UPI00129A50E0|nr:hypothetical protein [Foetidibacter luteolus]